LEHSPAVDVLDRVLSGGARRFVTSYQDEAGFLFNRAALQLAFALDRALRAAQPLGSPAGAKAAETAAPAPCLV
jgi:hypothetical protein